MVFLGLTVQVAVPLAINTGYPWYWILGIEYWILDAGYWILDIRSWILDFV